MRKYIAFCVAVIVVLQSLSCVRAVNTAPPNIKVIADYDVVKYSVGLNIWDGNEYDRKSIFEIFTDKNNIDEVPYVKLNSIIKIEFIDNEYPDSVKLYDYILNSDGSPKYTEKEVITVPVNFDNKELQFELISNPSVLLSSNSSDYEKGNSIRGFRLVCNWGKNTCEYGFILKSDAF